MATKRRLMDLTKANVERIDLLRWSQEPVPSRTFLVNQLLAEALRPKIEAIDLAKKNKAKA